MNNYVDPEDIISVDVKTLVRKVRKLSEKYPDFIYTAQFGATGVPAYSCSYLGIPGDPNKGYGCIVGQALQEMGVSREALANVDGNAVEDILDLTDAHYKETGWLTTVQSQQDRGKSWSRAVWCADHLDSVL